MQLYYEKVDEKLNAAALHEAAYALLYHVLRSKLGVEQPVVLKTPAGKPYLAESELKISLSHTRGLVCCAVGKGAEIGADCEYHRTVSQRVKERVCTERELSDIRKADDPDSRFLCYWTLKESIAKKRGVGLRESLRQYEILWEGERPVCAGYTLYLEHFDGFFVAAVE